MARRKLEPFLNVVANGRAVLNSKLVLGSTINRVILELGFTGAGAFTKAMIDRIRVKLNSKVVWDFSGDGTNSGGVQINMIRSYDSLHGAAANYLVLDFVDINSRTINGEALGGIDTVAQGITDFVIEVDIAGATTPTLEAYAELDPPLQYGGAQGPTGEDVLFRSLLPTTLTFSAAGEFTKDIGFGSKNGALIRRYHIFDPGGILTQLQVLKDSVEIFQEQSTAINEFLATDYGKTPQAGLWVFDPIVNGDQSRAIRTLRQSGHPAVFQNKFKVSGAGVLYVMPDLYTALQNI